MLRGRDIKRYKYNFADLWLINTHNGIKEKGIKPIQVEDFPSIKEHLDKYYPQLEKRQDKGDTPYNLRNCAYMEDFSKQKIIWKRVGSILRFCFDSFSCISLDSTCIATGKHMKFLLGFLNSKMGNYLLQNSPKTGTGDLLVSVQAIEPLKVPSITKDDEAMINIIVNDILDKKDDNDRLRLERQLNYKIYKLFKLNDEEIDFIESQKNL
ncbi:MAG: TaqI-like C-terminal specificity domain-containing protein [Fermentimonas sp.]|nr:TaqI-like C-terminal specificity domain-containing protein [Fermentimonas sp.]